MRSALWRDIDGMPPPPFARLRGRLSTGLWMVFRDHYVPLLHDERDQVHAAEALVRAVERDPTAMDSAARMKETFARALDPFIQKYSRIAQRRALAECAYCGRPGSAIGKQCAGCGAWRRA